MVQDEDDYMFLGFNLHHIAWCACIIVCLAVSIWYIVYCVKIVRPYKKITIFSSDSKKQLDWELVKLIGVRFLTIVLATFSFCLALIYALTEHWLLPSFTIGIRISVLVGAVYLFIQALQSSTNSIHAHLESTKEELVSPTITPAEPNPELTPNEVTKK